MRRANRDEYSEILQVALIIFSAVSFATLEFLKNAFPAPLIIQPDKTTIVYALLLVQMAPTIALVALDRVLAARDPSLRWQRVFRTVVFSVALVLILRQLQIYSGTGKEFANDMRARGDLFLPLVGLISLSAIAALTIFAYKGVSQFFYYLAPVAVAMSAIIPFQVLTKDPPPSEFFREVQTVEGKAARDPVYVLVFDGLAYDLLIDKDGAVDGQRHPNFAALAKDSILFDNATTNNFHTSRSVPMIADPLRRLTDYYNVRLYSALPEVEDAYAEGCGRTYACRGVRYLTAHNRALLATNAGLRTYENIMPEPLDWLTKWPMGLVVNGLDIPYPAADPGGFHIFTKRLFDEFISNVRADTASGSMEMLHIYPPHLPEAFHPDGSAVSSRLPPKWERAPKWEATQNMLLYADRLLGRFVDRLKQEGLYDRATIVVTADHGFRNLEGYGGGTPTDEAAHVLLMVHAPGIVAGSTSHVDYQHIDMGPTLTDLLNLPAIEGSVGVSAFAGSRPERDKIFYILQNAYIYNTKTGNWEKADPEHAILGRKNGRVLGGP